LLQQIDNYSDVVRFKRIGCITNETDVGAENARLENAGTKTQLTRKGGYCDAMFVGPR